jgi:hypothetical protein
MAAELIGEDSTARIGVPDARTKAQLMSDAGKVLSIPTAIMREKEFEAHGAVSAIPYARCQTR